MDKHLLLGHPDIDRQHNDLFSVLARLRSINDEHAIADALSLLTELLHAHFDAEEKLLDSLDMPAEEKQKHVRAHHAIVEDLAAIHLNTMVGLRIPLEEIVDRASGYVLKHIIEFDLKLKVYIPEAVSES